MSYIESCESRLFLSVTAKLSKTGVLTINGTSGDDLIFVDQPSETNVNLGFDSASEVLVNAGKSVRFLSDYGRLAGNGNRFDASLVKKIIIKTGRGNDITSVNLHLRGVTALIEGGAGNDSLSTSLKNSTLLGGSGSDFLSSVSTNRLTIHAITESRNNSTSPRIVIDATKNVLDGGPGNDTLTSAGGEDSLLGGEGDDTLLKNTESEIHLRDLPPLPAPTTPTNAAPQRIAAFGVESIVDGRSFNYESNGTSTYAVATFRVIVRRDTIN